MGGGTETMHTATIFCRATEPPTRATLTDLASCSTAARAPVMTPILTVVEIAHGTAVAGGDGSRTETAGPNLVS